MLEVGSVVFTNKSWKVLLPLSFITSTTKKNKMMVVKRKCKQRTMEELVGKWRLIQKSK